VLPPNDVVDGVKVFRLPFTGGRRFFLAPTILGRVTKYNLVHVHAIDFFVDYLAITKWYHGRPLIVSTHGGFFHTSWALGAKWAYFHTVTRLALGQVNRVICVSRQDDRLFASIVPSAKRVVIGNGIDDMFFRSHESAEPGLLLVVGRIAENKRIDRLIDLLPLIRREIPESQLVIIGPDSDGLRATLEAQARARGVGRSVFFVGAVDDETLREYVARAHLVLAPSDYEGFGISVVEAMAAGALVVANAMIAFREIIHSGVNGFLVDFADARTAAHAIVAAMRLPLVERVKIGAQARATASQFRWDAVVGQVEQVYRHALGRNVVC